MLGQDELDEMRLYVAVLVRLVASSDLVKGDQFRRLLEAIQAANNSAETVTISFNISDPLVDGAHTISIGAGGLPAITDTVIIEGTTDSDYAGDPIIRIDGSTAGAAG